MFSNVINLPNNEKKDTKQKKQKTKNIKKLHYLFFFFFSLISKLKAFKRVGPAHSKKGEAWRQKSFQQPRKQERPTGATHFVGRKVDHPKCHSAA